MELLDISFLQRWLAGLQGVAPENVPMTTRRRLLKQIYQILVPGQAEVPELCVDLLRGICANVGRQLYPSCTLQEAFGQLVQEYAPDYPYSTMSGVSHNDMLEAIVDLYGGGYGNGYGSGYGSGYGYN